MNTREFKERIAAIDEDLFPKVVVMIGQEEYDIESTYVCTACGSMVKIIPSNEARS